MREGKQSTAAGVPPLRIGIICIRDSFADAHWAIAGDSLTTGFSSFRFMYIIIFLLENNKERR
jgi:hypothetical protein